MAETPAFEARVSTVTSASDAEVTRHRRDGGDPGKTDQAAARKRKGSKGDRPVGHDAAERSPGLWMTVRQAGSVNAVDNGVSIEALVTLGVCARLIPT